MEPIDLTTDKDACRILVSVLCRHGVREAVLSPGSRNAPIVVAVSACREIKTTVVVDERSAAFVALGKASVSGSPVMLVCTSGTALLNYAPAVAEAYYRNVPLVVVSADRPMEWIDQDDSQTLRQFEALSHYVKRSYNIPSACGDYTSQWYVNRVANDAMINCMTARRAPVHINVQIDTPLGGLVAKHDEYWTGRIVSMAEPKSMLTDEQKRMFARMFGPSRKVLVIAGFLDPSPRLSETLAALTESGNVAVMCETVSNLRGENFVYDIDATLSSLDEKDLDLMRPDTVVTIGGAIVSRFIKSYLRKNVVTDHIHVGFTDNTIDCFQSLTLRVPMHPADFFAAILPSVVGTGGGRACDYCSRWNLASRSARSVHSIYTDGVAWSDLKAMRYVMSNLPKGCALQLSNGTSVRYAQLFPPNQVGRCDCNRGVSGIDGCTSTAVGASTAFDGTTILITGDMSAQYDMGAFSLPCVAPSFKMIVLCNGGGGIFRFIDSTAALPQLEEYFVVPRHFPLAKIADAYGFACFEASSMDTLAEQFPRFIAESGRPAVLALHTPSEESAEVLRGFFRLKST
ncbi:MAG: 2-succinyl-5-enolpyruvyl-6-hydroxy-3-cyclohexene-1-carboxylic-acid synthase [Muribaculum sp.]|nr:2-succinyl-5-enolpyruvyl-6-hydroxy-3-cyclohexene-1-carboxylic-acid synthase [Muribaculum sp.]